MSFLTKKKVQKSRKHVSNLLSSDMSAKEVGTGLFTEYNSLHGWSFKDEAYQKELHGIIEKHLKDNGLSLADYL